MTSLIATRALDEPLLLQNVGTVDYKVARSRIKNALFETEVVSKEKSASRENESYVKIVNLIAKKLHAVSSTPLSNASIDIAANCEHEPYIFEIRLIDEENALLSIREGINNLYEQRYLQNVPSANLILVTQNALPNSLRWMEEFLETDRNIYLVWWESGKLNTTERVQQKLSFLK